VDFNHAHTTEIDTSILRTCRSLRQSGLEVLRKNKFVIITADSASLDEDTNAACVPIARGNKTFYQDNKLCLLRFHFNGLQKPYEPAKTKKQHSVMMIMGDVPLLIRKLALKMVWQHPQLSIIRWDDTGYGKQVAARVPKPKQCLRTLFKFYHVDKESMTAELQSALLRPFESLVVPFQKVTVLDSVIPPAQLDTLQRLMGPKTI
jgi:hypothetical protein